MHSLSSLVNRWYPLLSPTFTMYALPPETIAATQVVPITAPSGCLRAASTTELFAAETAVIRRFRTELRFIISEKVPRMRFEITSTAIRLASPP